MDIRAKPLIVAGLAVAGVALGFVWLPAHAVNGMCAADVVTVLPSPGDRLDAVLYEYDCGGTTAFGTDVSILAHGAVPTSPGNVLVADANHGAAPLTKGHVL